MRFEVPQFIEIEDKIFGPFTWRQFVYLGGGVGLAIVLLFIAPFFIFVFIGIPIAALAAALAFYPINNRPFSDFLEAMWRYYKTDRMYYWRKKSDAVYKQDLQQRTTQTDTPSPESTAVSSGRNINSLSRKLELNAIQKTQ